MNVVISGIALSLQWAPSLQQTEYLFSGRYQAVPSLVEHPGEVIKKALMAIPDRDSASLTILQLGEQANLGHYLPMIKNEFHSLETPQMIPGRLVDAIQLAADHIQSADQHYLLSETTPAGTAAFALSHPEGSAEALIRLKNLEEVQPLGLEFDYLAAASLQDLAELIQLDHQIAHLQSDRPAILGSFNAPHANHKSIPVLMQAVLAILHQVIPTGAGSQEIFQKEVLENIISQEKVRPWLYRGDDFKRTALFCEKRLTSPDWDFIVLEEIPRSSTEPSVRIIPESDPYLFLVTGNNLQSLNAGLDGLEHKLTGSSPLVEIATNVYAKYTDQKGHYTCCLLGLNRDQLQKEIRHARTGIEKSFHEGLPWTSPSGSYFTPLPLEGDIAFVYPGGFNSYSGMARELLYSFPGLQDAARATIPNLSHSLAEEILYPLSQAGRDKDSEGSLDDFYAQPNQLIESGISLAVLHTLLLDRVFNLKPDVALGYSLGEASMLWANQVWQNGGESSKSWSQSNLLQDQLVGDMLVVRKFWDREDLSPDFWATYILKESPQRAQAACDQNPLVFLTIQNTPEEVVIAGEKNACQEVIEMLDCRALPVPFSPAIHNPAMEASLSALRELYSNSTFPRKETRFYSAADYQELIQTQDSLSSSIANMTCSPIDFPRLVNKAYADGARLFIEVGPQKTCSRWIEKILIGKPHAAIPINKKYQGDLVGVMKVVCLLVSHGVKLQLEHFYQTPPTRPTSKPTSNRLNSRAGPDSRFSHKEPRKIRDFPSISFTPGSPAEAAGFIDHLDRISAGTARSHQSFLVQQQTLTRNLARVLQMQEDYPSRQKITPFREAARFSREQIKEFTCGDPSHCFGDLFAAFEDRRIPRLPNGPLQFIDRVIEVPEIMGQIISQGSLTSEYDLPARDWFRPDPSHSLPHVALMELALQPCGFLSAYMGSILGRESQDLYFRNLDGEGILLEWPHNLVGPLTNRVQLISSSSLDQVIIQKYRFELSWGGETFFQGSSSFGYFTRSMLADQAGLDGGLQSKPWLESHPGSGSWQDLQSASNSQTSLEDPHLPRPRQAWIASGGGQHGKGYLYLKLPIPAETWYFRAHFYQDPVMPGSLGVETMAQALMATTTKLGLNGNHRWQITPDSNLLWKYRGQITPDVREISLELHIKSVKKRGSNWEITADGQLWKGSTRIYQVENLSLESLPL